jgi:oxygen-dependent protoporphyrinogen oxidase
MSRIVIAGGGIAGLSIAFALRKRDPSADVVVLERAARAGGNIRTERIDGYTCEWGPDGFLDDAPETLRLVHDLGLEPRLQPCSASAKRRFIVRHGRLCAVPTSPPALVTTRLLSLRAKVRLAFEPFAAPRTDDDESIHDFAARRIGSEAAETLVGAMVSGIFAGDPRALSLQACFPRMRQLEDEHGGLIRALLAKRRKSASNGVGAPRGRLTSFVGGMNELIDGLTASLGRVVRTSSPVTRLSRPSDTPAGFTVATAEDMFRADAVVLAGPAAQSAALLRDADPRLADLLDGIPTAPLAVVCLGYDAASLGPACTLNGFGFLVPRTEPFRILGTLWETSIYPERAPAGKVLLRVMIGGACDPEAVTLDDERLTEVVLRDLAAIMGVSRRPEFVRIIRHARGIPQYVKGHPARLREIDERLETMPGLFVAGNSYRGVSINSCVSEAGRIASDVLGYVDRARPAAVTSVVARSA